MGKLPKPKLEISGVEGDSPGEHTDVRPVHSDVEQGSTARAGLYLLIVDVTV